MSFENCNITTRRKVDFGALIRLMAEGIRPTETFYAIGGAEVAFELYRWMTSSVTTPRGGPSERWSWPTRWVRESIAANISDRMNCGSDMQITPIRGSAYLRNRHQDGSPVWGWRKTLARRFHAALFLEGPETKWRMEMGIDPAKPRMISMLTYDNVPPPPRATHYGFRGEPTGWRMRYGDPAEGNGFPGEIDRLFALATPSRRLIRQLNSCHADARFLTDVLLAPTHAGWICSTEYGVGGSRWSGPSVKQKKGEPFSHFIYRAHDKIDPMLTPICRMAKPCRDVQPPEIKKAYAGICSGVECEEQAR